ncbi:MAG: Lrp/AsnC ligand binding domain-containing protein [Candidatus Helarchaeota archaeon]
MKERKIIKAYSLVLNTPLFDELKVKAYIFFREDPNIQIRKEDEHLIKNLPQVSKFSRLFGKYDGIIEISVKDNDEVTAIINKLHALQGIKETETFITHTILKDSEITPILYHLQEE